MEALERLFDHWQRLGPSSAPYIHNRDKPFLVDRQIRFEDHLTPYPYLGDLRRARVWLLMLNSSVDSADAADEQQPYFKELSKRNIEQDFAGVEFPFFSLDPQLEGTGTYRYYNTKRGLGQLVRSLAVQRAIPEVVARKLVSQYVAVLELLPYRSKNFPAAAAQLPSVNLSRAAAHEALAQRLLLVPWGADHWRLPRNAIQPNLITQGARTFSFAPGGASGFGEAILDRLATIPLP